MIALLQRVRHARVAVDNQVISEIDHGLLLFIGIEKNDKQTDADRLIERFINYRVFADEQGKMNLCVRDIKGGILLVPQFTLAADTGKGARPSFSEAASPRLAQALFDYVIQQTQRQYPYVGNGQFGADMQVSLLNDGPVTFWLQT